jgi:hypothetical protein
VKADRGWQRAFDEPIPLPCGGRGIRLRGSGVSRLEAPHYPKVVLVSDTVTGRIAWGESRDVSRAIVDFCNLECSTLRATVRRWRIKPCGPIDWRYSAAACS